MDSLPQVEALRSALRERGAAGFLTVDPDQQVWLAGFRALIYSRPIVLFVGLEELTLIVPELEHRHALEHARVDRVEFYAERPEVEAAGSHLPLLDALLDSLPAAPVAIDEQRLPVAFAAAVRARGRELVEFGSVVSDLVEVKHPAEVDAVRRASELIVTGVRASLDACRPGISELEVDGVGAEAILGAASELGPDTTVELLTMTPSGRERTLLPHVFSSARRMERGDVLIHTRQLAIDGYRTELERTAFVGAPDAAQIRAFETMLVAQQAAMDAVAPGVPASDVDGAAREVFAEAGFALDFPCRTGHGIAIGVHEPPHLRYDNPEPLVAGMVVTIEPGIYVSGLGGFRHSDTVVVTESGMECLTTFPRSLDEMILEF